MMFIDTHAHVNFKDYRDDAEEVIRRSLGENTWMILVGSEFKTSRRSLDYANKYEKGVYAAVGLHPTQLEDSVIYDKKMEAGYQTYSEEFNYDNYEKLAHFDKVVAIGEIGLDYFHLEMSGNVSEIKKKQKDVFVQQLMLARSLDLPAIIHCRQAHDDMLAILTELKNDNKKLFPSNRPWAVMHCFSGNEDLAWRYFNLGLLISFTGLVTFSKQWDDLIRKMPLDKFMIETDCPYMTPEPFRGQRNEPILVRYVAERIAEIKGLSLGRIADQTTATARSFFGI